jgi:hypothetical protein
MSAQFLSKHSFVRSLSCFFLFIVMVSLTVSLASCGRKSAVKPPEEGAPGPVIFPRLEARSNSVLLLWLPPKETAGGDEIVDDLQYEILRRPVGKDVFERFDEIAIIETDSSEETPANKSFEYEDFDIQQGKQYEYLIVPRDSYGYEGIPDIRLRVTFIGAASVVETLPFFEDEEDEDDDAS